MSVTMSDRLDFDPEIIPELGDDVNVIVVVPVKVTVPGGREYEQFRDCWTTLGALRGAIREEDA